MDHRDSQQSLCLPGLDALVLTATLKQSLGSTDPKVVSGVEAPGIVLAKRKLLDIVAFEKARPLLLENWGFGDVGDLSGSL